MSNSNVVSIVTKTDLTDLYKAHHILENPSFAMRLASVVGSPVELGVKMLPDGISQKIHQITTLSVEKTFNVAVLTLPKKRLRPLPHRLYTGTAIGMGALGGLAGLPSLAVELPITTTLLLRAIADVAQQEGEQLDDIESRLACMEVFALGGISKEDDAAETGYYGVRFGLSTLFNQATQYISVHGMSQKGAPVLVSLISSISSRFGAVISQKTALQMLPIAGAVGGAAVNGLFMEHFKEMAQGHFTMRRLEKKYGQDMVHTLYNGLGVPGYSTNF